MRALHRCLALALPLVLADRASAEGLVQLSFDGHVMPAGGAPIELELGFWDGSEVRELSLNIHLGWRTTAADLGSLLAARLERSGARVLLPGAGAASEGPTHLFVEAVTHASLRLGHGLSGAITLSDSEPASIRVQPPEIRSGSAMLTVAATTFHHHDRRIGSKELRLELDALDTPGQVSESLARVAIDAGWVADRPTPDRWAASRMNDGAEITGCSVLLVGADRSDWRIEVRLAVPRPDR